MASETARTLGIGPGARVALVDAPVGLVAALEPLPPDAALVRPADGPVDVLAVFEFHASTLADRLGTLTRAVRTGGALWVCWPRPGGGVATDLSEQTVRQTLAAQGFDGGAAIALPGGWDGVRLSPHASGAR
jgi:hypothetical protein